MRYLDRDGKPSELIGRGPAGNGIQHEIDHLEGRLIIDFLSRLKRDMIVRRFRKQARGGLSRLRRRPAGRVAVAATTAAATRSARY